MFSWHEADTKRIEINFYKIVFYVFSLLQQIKKCLLVPTYGLLALFLSISLAHCATTQKQLQSTSTQPSLEFITRFIGGYQHTNYFSELSWSREEQRVLRALLKSIRIKLLSNFCTWRLQFQKIFLALDQIRKLIIIV